MTRSFEHRRTVPHTPKSITMVAVTEGGWCLFSDFHVFSTNCQDFHEFSCIVTMQRTYHAMHANDRATPVPIHSLDDQNNYMKVKLL